MDIKLKYFSATLLATLSIMCGCGGGGTENLNSTEFSMQPGGDVIATTQYQIAPVIINDPALDDALIPSASASIEPKKVLVPGTAAGIKDIALRKVPLQTENVQAQAASPRAVTTFTPAQIRAAYNMTALPAANSVLTPAMMAAQGGGQTIYIVNAYHNPNVLSGSISYFWTDKS